MIRPLTLLSALIATPVAAQQMDVPSGAPVLFHEVILEEETGFARFRFIVDGLGGTGLEPADLGEDFGWLCDNVVLPALTQNGWDATQIIISMADQVFPFGEVVPDVVQYFEGYSIADGTCIWEPF